MMMLDSGFLILDTEYSELIREAYLLATEYPTSRIQNPASRIQHLVLVQKQKGLPLQVGLSHFINWVLRELFNLD